MERISCSSALHDPLGTRSADGRADAQGPVAFGLTALLVLAVVLIACAVPASRAAAVDPAVALRTPVTRRS